ncbi:MAG: SDR family oxidoreductase [Nitrospinota bacterium]
MSPEEVLREVERGIPLGRIGRPEELAALVVFLALPASSYIAGAAFQVDGGRIRSLY